MLNSINISFTLSISLGFILAIIKYRIFKEKLNISFTEHLNDLQVNVILVGFLISIILLLFTFIGLILLYRIPRERKRLRTVLTFILQYKMCQYILTTFLYLVNTFSRAYIFVYNWLDYKTKMPLLTFGRNFSTWSQYYTLIIIIYEIIPRILILLIFVIEIYSQKLNYYFFSLALLLIPLIFKGIVFMLKDLGPRVILEVDDMLIFSNPEKITLTPDYPSEVDEITVKLKPEYTHLGLDNVLNYFYYPFLALPNVLETKFLPKYRKIRLFGLVFYYFIHTIGWGYILFTIAT